MTLSINGLFSMDIFHRNGEQVSEQEEQQILSSLQSGKYVIGIESKCIYLLEDFTVLYTFLFSPTDAVEYDFEE